MADSKKAAELIDEATKAFMEQKLEAVITHGRAALEADPGAVKAFDLLAIALFHLGRYDEAVEAATAWGKVKQSAKQLRLLAEAGYLAGDKAAVREAATALAGLSSAPVPVRAAVALVAADLGLKKQAADLLEPLEKEAASDSAVVRASAWASIHGGAAKEGRAKLEAIAAAADNDADQRALALALLALDRLEQDDRDGAKEALGRASEVSGQEASVVALGALVDGKGNNLSSAQREKASILVRRRLDAKA